MAENGFGGMQVGVRGFASGLGLQLPALKREGLMLAEACQAKVATCTRIGAVSLAGFC